MANPPLANGRPEHIVRSYDDQLRRLLETARRLLQRNLGPGLRRTTSSSSAERLFVYHRGGQPCLRCGATVERIVQAGRSTWLCPACQSPSRAGGRTMGAP